jgi:membrane-associated phospholipid phosphatase
LIVAACSGPAGAQVGIGSLRPGSPAGRGTIAKTPTGIDLTTLGSSRTACILLAGGVLAWFSWNLEDAERIGRVLDQPAFEISDVGNAYGGGALLGAAAVALTAMGQLTRRPAALEMGGGLSRSLVVSTAAVWTLKLGVGRRRPNGARYSFPSGHTAAAFAVAPVIVHHLGAKAAVPAYALAGLTAIARMEDRRHYLSDVLFGAAIGLAAGDAVVGGGSLGSLLRHLSISPNRIGLSFGF